VQLNQQITSNHIAFSHIVTTSKVDNIFFNQIESVPKLNPQTLVNRYFQVHLKISVAKSTTPSIK